MIYSVKGQVIHTEPNLAVIESGGVGFACRTTGNTLSGLKTGEETRLFTYLHVREDAVELFGFGTNQELHAFKLLISVSGVGPKAALSVLSNFSPQDFALCIASGDSKLLTRTPGIGAKIAQRIVLELKDKIDAAGTFEINGENGRQISAGIKASGSNASEAVSALAVLGFTAGQTAKALEGIDRNMSTQDMIKAALKKLSS